MEPRMLIGVESNTGITWTPCKPVGHADSAFSQVRTKNETMAASLNQHSRKHSLCEMDELERAVLSIIPTNSSQEDSTRGILITEDTPVDIIDGPPGPLISKTSEEPNAFIRKEIMCATKMKAKRSLGTARESFLCIPRKKPKQIVNGRTNKTTLQGPTKPPAKTSKEQFEEALRVNDIIFKRPVKLPLKRKPKSLVTDGALRGTNTSTTKQVQFLVQEPQQKESGIVTPREANSKCNGLAQFISLDPVQPSNNEIQGDTDNSNTDPTLVAEVTQNVTDLICNERQVIVKNQHSSGNVTPSDTNAGNEQAEFLLIRSPVPPAVEVALQDPRVELAEFVIIKNSQVSQQASTTVSSDPASSEHTNIELSDNSIVFSIDHLARFVAEKPQVKNTSRKSTKNGQPIQSTRKTFAPPEPPLDGEEVMTLMQSLTRPIHHPPTTYITPIPLEEFHVEVFKPNNVPKFSKLTIMKRDSEYVGNITRNQEYLEEGSGRVVATFNMGHSKTYIEMFSNAFISLETQDGGIEAKITVREPGKPIRYFPRKDSVIKIRNWSTQ